MDATILLRQLGTSVREHRLALGMTQRELAARAHVSERLVRDLEAGMARGIGFEKLVAILNALDIRLVVDGELAAQDSDDDGGAAYTALLQQAMRSWDGAGGGES